LPDRTPSCLDTLAIPGRAIVDDGFDLPATGLLPPHSSPWSATVFLLEMIGRVDN